MNAIDVWCPRQDSNLQLHEQKSRALSSWATGAWSGLGELNSRERDGSPVPNHSAKAARQDFSV